MGRIRTSNIKKISFDLVNHYNDMFTNDYAENKTSLNKLNIKLDKSVRNKIAGYITVIKKRKSR